MGLCTFTSGLQNLTPLSGNINISTTLTSSASKRKLSCLSDNTMIGNGQFKLANGDFVIDIDLISSAISENVEQFKLGNGDFVIDIDLISSTISENVEQFKLVNGDFVVDIDLLLSFIGKSVLFKLKM